jgi:hypothetical protein
MHTIDRYHLYHLVRLFVKKNLPWNSMGRKLSDLTASASDTSHRTKDNETATRTASRCGYRDISA